MQIQFRREDWTSFRTIEGLQRKAGVSADKLRRLVLKELGDNALDTGSAVRGGHTGKSDTFFVEDGGPGLDGTPEEIAELFSISRPMVSSKLLRRPQRGALGNGLRVVAGAVLASAGSLVVFTRNQRIVLEPQAADGTTKVARVSKVMHPHGTRVEIGFGPTLPHDPQTLLWIRQACEVAGDGKTYKGRSSPHWYDAESFHELLAAAGDQPVRDLIAQLDGCTGTRAGEIVNFAGLARAKCSEIDRAQAIRLLNHARVEARSVRPQRLGGLGGQAFPHMYYAIQHGTASLGSAPSAEIPFVAEAWARKLDPDESHEEDFTVRLLINRTPATDEVIAWRDSDKDLQLQGCGLQPYRTKVPKKGKFAIVIHLTMPYCPVTSDGKAPDLSACEDQIADVVVAALRRAQRAAPKEPRDEKSTQKAIVYANLDAAIFAISKGIYRFNQRQVYYRIRKIVKDQIGKVLKRSYFDQLMTDYENEHGEIPRMYHEPRGSIYHPHTGEMIPLSTLSVEAYERPFWLYNKIVFNEKEGFNEALKAVGWPKRHDCTLISSKGFATRAAKDLIDKIVADLVDKLAKRGEPVTIFCVHDADAYGTMIYQTFQNATKARGARMITIVNLGLEPWEAIEMGLDVEDIEDDDEEDGKPKRRAVADYVREREDRAPEGETWEEWLQTHRVELNAMTTPQFIEWLDRKMIAHAREVARRDGKPFPRAASDDEIIAATKLIPPADVIAAEVEQRLAGKVRADVVERILREAGCDQQVADALAAIRRPRPTQVTAGIKQLFASKLEAEWREEIERVTTELARRARTE